jgi:hypothetical protein
MRHSTLSYRAANYYKFFCRSVEDTKKGGKATFGRGWCGVGLRLGSAERRPAHIGRPAHNKGRRNSAIGCCKAETLNFDR